MDLELLLDSLKTPVGVLQAGIVAKYDDRAALIAELEALGFSEVYLEAFQNPWYLSDWEDRYAVYRHGNYYLEIYFN